MEENRKLVKNYRATLIVLTAIYCAFVLLYEKRHAQQGEKGIEKHAQIIADDLWNFNGDGVAEYLKLAAESGHYQRLTVVNHNGEVFKEVVTEFPSQAESVGIRLRLIPKVVVISTIEYDQKHIGWIEGVWIPQTLLPHFTAFCFFAMIFLVILLYQRASNEKILLEKNVQERTNDLSLANQKLISEIEERLAAERALQRYQHIVSSTDDMMFFVDVNYVYQAVNQAYLKAHKKEVEEVVGRHVVELMGPAMFDQVVKGVLDKAFQGETVQYQEWFEYSGRDRRYMDIVFNPYRSEEGNIEGVVVTVHDLTSRYRAQEALRESEEKFRELVENINDVLFSADARGRLTYVSPLFSSWTDWNNEEIIGQSILEFVVSEDAATVKTLIERTQREPVQIYEFRMSSKTDRVIWVRCSSRPKIRGDQVIGLQGVLTDITDNKKLESQLLQAQKMEAVGTLAGGIAHDFNNLLMGVQGYVSLLQLELSGRQPASQYLENIESYVQSGAGLTKQLLGFARGGKYEVRPANLNTLIRKSSDIFARTRKNIEVKTLLAKDLWIVDVDEQQIEQVMLNLYLNGSEAMPDGGQLILRSENYLHSGAQYSALHLQAGEYVKISVEDTGVGMDPDTVHRIFDPFFTTKEVSRGTGLGLASCYGIISSHKGEIIVSSEKGKGTTFSVFLPATHNEVEDKEEGRNGVLKGTGRLLIVDDEQMVLDVSKELLQTLGYTVETALNGREALQKFRDNHQKFSLIVLDLIMPGMNGGEVYDRLREINPKTKVLLSSGYSIDGQARAIMERGGDGFIQKPFSLLEISHKIKSVLDA